MTQIGSIAADLLAEMPIWRDLVRPELISRQRTRERDLAQVGDLLDSQYVYVFAGQDSSNPPVPDPGGITSSSFYLQDFSRGWQPVHQRCHRDRGVNAGDSEFELQQARPVLGVSVATPHSDLTAIGFHQPATDSRKRSACSPAAIRARFRPEHRPPVRTCVI